MTKKPKELPEDPRDYYVAEKKLTLTELAEIYKGRPGCSYRNLRDRCCKERWITDRHRLNKKKKQKTHKLVADQLAEKEAEVTLSVLARLNKKHNKRIAWLYDLNEQLIKQCIVENPDGSTLLTLTFQDLRRAVQNESDLMTLERLVNNLPMNKPGEEIVEETVNKILGALEKTAKQDWADHAKPTQADEPE